MTAPDKKRRDELRHELDEGAPGMSEVSLFPDELRALIDGYARRGAALEQVKREASSLIHAERSVQIGDVRPIGKRLHRIARDAELERLREKVAHYERDLNDGHQDRLHDTDWLRAGFLQRGAELEKLEDAVRALAQTLGDEAAAHQERWRTGASQHYEGRSDQAGEDAERVLKLLGESASEDRRHRTERA